MSYKVTVAMPVYNVGQDIKRAMLSALSQTFESIEFLIIDDKGDDNSIDIANEIINHHPRGKDVRIIDHKVNRGTGATKNSAIKEAKGEYLYFMDSDDVIREDCIELLYAEITRNPVNFVAASFRKVSPDGKTELSRSQFSNMTLKQPYALAEYRKGKDERFYIMTWNKLFDLNFIRENRISCIAHRLNEDVWFSFQLNYCTCAFTLIDTITYDWYVRANSTTNTVINRGLTEAKVDSFLEDLAYKQQAISTNPKASSCPYIVDDVIEFCLRLSENILRSSIPIAKKKELILKVTDLRVIADKKADILYNRFVFALFRSKHTGYRLAHLYFIRYGRGVIYAMRHPIIMIRKKLVTKKLFEFINFVLLGSFCSYFHLANHYL